MTKPTKQFRTNPYCDRWHVLRFGDGRQQIMSVELTRDAAIAVAREVLRPNGFSVHVAYVGPDGMRHPTEFVA